MDKETLSNYGWIVIAVLVLAVMIALATPFGHFIENGVKSTAQGLFDVNQSAGALAGLDIPDQTIAEPSAGDSGGTPTKVPVYYVGVTSTSTGDYTGATAIYYEGDSLPSTVNDGDVYVYGDYEYRYNLYNYGSWKSDTTQNGWGVHVLDDTKTTYGAILESINGKPVTSMTYTFRECTSLTTAPVIPSSVRNMYGTFFGCISLVTAPVIPSSVTYMTYTFQNCTALVTAPVIPSSVMDMSSTFQNCTSLTGTIEINATNLAGYSDCFESTSKPITLTGTCSKLANIASSFSNVTVQ